MTVELQAEKIAPQVTWERIRNGNRRHDRVPDSWLVQNADDQEGHRARITNMG